MHPDVSKVQQNEVKYTPTADCVSIGNNLSGHSVACSYPAADDNTLANLQAKNKIELRKKEISDKAKEFGVSREFLLNWIQKYVGFTEEELLSISDENEIPFQTIIMTAGEILSRNKDSKISNEDLLNHYGEYCLELKKTGKSLKEIADSVDDSDIMVNISAKNAAKGLTGVDLKNATFLQILHKYDKSMSKYSSLTEIPEKDLVKCAKNIIAESIKKINGKDKDKVKAQMEVFRTLMANTPYEQFKYLYAAIKDAFNTNELKDAIKSGLETINQSEDGKNLDELINYLEKQFDLNDKDLEGVKLLLLQHKETSVLSDDAKNRIKNFHTGLSEDEKSTVLYINNKINLYLQDNAEKISSLNIKLTAEELGLVSDEEKEVFEKYSKELNEIARIRLAILENKRYNTTDNDKKEAENVIKTELEKNGFSYEFLNIKTNEVIDEVLKTNPEFFDGKSKKEICSIIDSYTDGAFSDITSTKSPKEQENLSGEALGTQIVGLTQKTTKENCQLIAATTEGKKQKLYGDGNDNKSPITIEKSDKSFKGGKICFNALSGSDLFKAIIKNIDDALGGYNALALAAKNTVDNIVKSLPRNLQSYYLNSLGGNVVIPIVKHTKINPEELNLRGLTYYQQNELKNI